MKTGNRFFAAVLSLCLLMSSLPFFSAVAEEDNSIRIEAETAGSAVCHSNHKAINLENKTNTAGWSGGGFTFVNMENTGSADNVPDVVATYTLPVDKVGVYNLSLTAKTGSTRGIWDVYFNDVLIDTVDTYAAGSGTMTDFDLGNVTFKDTSATVKLVSVGMNAAVTDFRFGLALDYFTLTQLNVYDAYRLEAETCYKSGTGNPNNAGLYVIAPGQNGAYVNFELTVPQSGVYNLSLTDKDNPDRGIYEAYLNDKLIATVDFYNSATNGAFVTHSLGTVTFNETTANLKLVCVGANASAQKHALAADYLTITPVIETAQDQAGTVSVVGRGYLDASVNGDTVTLTAEAAFSGKSPHFAGWMVNGVWSAETTVTVPANGKNDVTAYFVNKDETVLRLYGKGNQLFAVQVVASQIEAVKQAMAEAEIPDIYGYEFAAWSESDDDLAGQLGGSSVAATAQYKQNVTKSYTVTVTDATAFKGNEGQSSAFQANFDDRVTVTANPADDSFSYWKLDDMVVSFEETYTFYVSGDNTIKAVYNDSTESADIVRVAVKKTYITPESNGSTYKWTVIPQIYAPKAATVVEYGVYFAPGSVDLKNLNGLTEGVDYLKVAASSKTPNRQYMISLRHVKASASRRVMGYITVEINGQTQTVYSETKGMVWA